MHNDIAIVFVVLVSIAIVIQLGILYGIFKALSRLNQEVTEARNSFERNKEPFFNDLRTLLTQAIDLLGNLNRISADFTKVAATAREQMEKVDGVVTETADMARRHVHHLDSIVSDAIEHIERTSRVVQENILAPVREVSAVIKGVKMGLEFLTSKRQPATVDKVTQDEAMFI